MISEHFRKTFLNRKIKGLQLFLKGSSRDPFLYLGIISVILFGLTVLTPHHFLNSSAGSIIKNKGNFFASVSGALNNDQLIFLNQEETKIESPDLYLIQNNALKSVSPPITLSSQVLGSLIGSDETFSGGPEEVIEYTVLSGDSLSTIAENFGISLNTLLWANHLSESSIIRPGQKLVVPPVSGVIYHVKSGDTLGQIAKTHKGEVDEIIAFNGLSKEGDIYIGDILIIPGGIMPPAIRYAPSSVPLASSYFICPISAPCRITQGLHWYNAIDFGHGKCSEPVFAAAGGKVQKTGYNSKAGNYIRILHPNGVVTSYNHFQSISVDSGQKVSQGEIIGLVGYTGYTIPAGPGGCHLHFGVRGARNPFAK